MLCRQTCRRFQAQKYMRALNWLCTYPLHMWLPGTVSIILLCIPCVVILMTPIVVCLLYVNWHRRNKDSVAAARMEAYRAPSQEEDDILQQGTYIKPMSAPRKKKVTFKKGRSARKRAGY